MANSQFLYVSETPHLLIEVDPNSYLANFNEFGILRVENDQFLNGKSTYISYSSNNYQKVRRETNNTFDQTSLPFDIRNQNVLNRLTFDFNIREYENLNPNISFTNFATFQSIFPNLTNLNLFYHTIKVYVIQGYNFDRGDLGFLTKAWCEDTKDGRMAYVASNSFLKTDDTLKYLTSPIRFDDRIYDRYLDIKVLSLQSLHRVARILDNTNTGIEQFTLPSMDTFLLRVSLNPIVEIDTDSKGQQTITTRMSFDVSSVNSVSINLNNDNEKFGSTLKENKESNFFEFFATYNNSFINEYIASMGLSNVIVFHTLTIYEQSATSNGYSEIATSSETFMQTNNFDVPFLFRPVIRNRNTIAFRIEYFMRLVRDSVFSDDTQGHIIRRSTLEVQDAQRYGRNPQVLQVNALKPNKIVNKIIQNDNKTSYDNLNTSTFNNVPFNKMNILKSEYIVPVDRFQISTTNEVISDIENYIPILFDEKNLWAYGTLNLQLSKYSDYFLNFNLFLKRRNQYEPIEVDRDTNTIYEIIFQGEDGEIIKQNIFPFNDEARLNNPGLFFRLNAEDVENISDGTQFYIRKLNYLSANFFNESQVNTNFIGVLYWGNVNIV